MASIVSWLTRSLPNGGLGLGPFMPKTWASGDVGGGIRLIITIDDRELARLVDDVGRAAGNVEETVRRRLVAAAAKVKDNVAAETPVYSGGGQGNQPGTLRESWEVINSGHLAYEVVTKATSKEGTPWAIAYEDVVEILSRGHSEYQIWPRTAGFTSLPGYGRYTTKSPRYTGYTRGTTGPVANWLSWHEGGEWVTTPMVLRHGIRKNDFLEKAMDRSAGLLEQLAYDCIFDIEMDIVHGTTMPTIGRGLLG